MGKMRLNVGEVAAACGVSKHTVHRARRSGALRAHAKGKRWFYYEPWDVVEWLTHRPEWSGCRVDVLTPDEMVVPYDAKPYSPPRSPQPSNPPPVPTDDDHGE